MKRVRVLIPSYSFGLAIFTSCFFGDARIASQLLGLTITTMESDTGPVAMVGFPHHQLDTYLRKLLQAGHRAAVCESDESPKEQPKQAMYQGKAVTPTKHRGKAKKVKSKPEAKPKAKDKAAKFTATGGQVKYGLLKKIRDIAMRDKPDPKWKPAIGEVVFIPGRVREQCEVHNSRYNRTDYVDKFFPTLSPRALFGKVIAYTQATGLVKIQDVTDQAWKVNLERVKKRFILIESIRPFRGWDTEKEKRYDPIRNSVAVSVGN